MRPPNSIIRLLTLSLLAAAVGFADEKQQSALPEPSAGAGEEMLLLEVPAIETAALYTQTLKDAPADVTVITDRDIRRYGYRTLAEALSGVRGFSVSTDGMWQYIGIRGFGLPGDYNTRVLVMLNGHYLTDNVYGAMYMFGNDFGVDMDLVQRIEIVRGPSSALYGSNGVFATVNIFTRSPADSARARFVTGFSSFGEKTTHASTSVYLGKGANLLLAGTGFHSSGYEADFAPNGLFEGGRTGSVGAEKGYGAIAQLTLPEWSIMAKFSDRRGQSPIGLYAAIFGDPGTYSQDGRDFVDAVWTRDVGKASNLRFRSYYDQFHYTGRYNYESEGTAAEQLDYARGNWVGNQFVFRTPLTRLGALTLGGEWKADIRNLQRTTGWGNPEVLDRDASQRDASYGAFAQQEWNINSRLTTFFGARFDHSKRHEPFVSPRVAMVYKHSDRSTYKFMYGRAFRNSSVFEQFWLPNPDLKPERMNTVELSLERDLRKNLKLLASAFHYRMGGLIEGVLFDAGTLIYENVSDARATGVELELQGRPASWLELTGSVSSQRVRYAMPSRKMPNSPQHLGAFRAAVPLLNNRLMLASTLRYQSERENAYGTPLTGTAIADLTATTQRLHPNFDLQFGVRNLGNTMYADPLTQEHLPSVLPRMGRTAFVRLMWHSGE